MDRTTEERVAGLEARMSNIEGDIMEIRGDTRAIHGRINDLVENELTHIKKDILRDRSFWAAVLGAGGALTIVLEVIIRIVFPI